MTKRILAASAVVALVGATAPVSASAYSWWLKPNVCYAGSTENKQRLADYNLVYPPSYRC